MSKKALVGPNESTVVCPHCGGTGHVKKATRGERDALFDAIVEITGVSSKTAGAFVAKAVKALMSESPPFTPDEVLRLPAVLNKRWPGVEIGIPAVTKYIGLVRSQPAETQQYSGIREWLEGER